MVDELEDEPYDGSVVELEEDVYNGEAGHALKHNAVNKQTNWLTQQWAERANDPLLSASFVRAAPFPTGNPAVDGPALTAVNEEVADQGGGRIICRPSPLGNVPYALNQTLVAYPGVSWEGVAPTPRQIERTTGIYLADGPWEYEGGTWFRGNGTFRAVAGNATPQNSLPAELGDTEIPGFSMVGFGFDNFTDGIALGAKNVMGPTHGILDQLYFSHCSGWSFRVVNPAHMTFGDIRAIVPAGATGGGIHVGVSLPVVTFQPGNCRIGEFYVFVSDAAPKARGIQFHAEGDNGGGSLAHLDGQRIQCNRFGTQLIQDTATLTSGTTNIAVTNGAQFAVGMPVQLDTAGNGFRDKVIYRVKSIAGNTITLATNSYGPAITATGAGTVGVKTYGMPNVEFTVGDPDSFHVASHFLNIDAEGVTSVGVYAERCFIYWLGMGVRTVGCLQNVVFRNVSNSQINAHDAVSTDFDEASASSSFFGTRSSTTQMPLRGLWNDTERVTNVLAIGNGANNTILNRGDFEVRSNGFIYPNFGVGERYEGINGPTTLYGFQCGNIVFSGGSAVTFTLPTITDDQAPPIIDSHLGLWFEIVNVGTATVTVVTDGTQRFNKVAGKFSVTVPPQSSMRVVAVRDSTNTRFWVARPTAALA